MLIMDLHSNSIHNKTNAGIRRDRFHVKSDVNMKD